MLELERTFAACKSAAVMSYERPEATFELVKYFFKPLFLKEADTNPQIFRNDRNLKSVN